MSLKIKKFFFAIISVVIPKTKKVCRYCTLCKCSVPSEEDGARFSSWIQRYLYSSQPSYFATEKTLTPLIAEKKDEKNEREKVAPQTAIFQKPTRIEDYKEKFRSRLE